MLEWENPMRRFLAIAMILTLGLANAQTRWEKLTKVEDGDTAVPTLKEWEQELADIFRKQGRVEPAISSWHVLQFDSLKTLFPQYRFFAVSWSERPTPGKLESLGIDLGVTLVIDGQGKRVKELQHNGDYEAFGELLKTAKIAIRNDTDAKLVWVAFCDAHQRHWQTQPSAKITDRTWHLGQSEVEGRRYYYDVKLDDDLMVESAKNHSEKVGE
jgi:hypothetical protein